MTDERAQALDPDAAANTNADATLVIEMPDSPSADVTGAVPAAEEESLEPVENEDGDDVASDHAAIGDLESVDAASPYGVEREDETGSERERADVVPSGPDADEELSAPADVLGFLRTFGPFPGLPVPDPRIGEVHQLLSKRYLVFLVSRDGSELARFAKNLAATHFNGRARSCSTKEHGDQPALPSLQAAVQSARPYRQSRPLVVLFDQHTGHDSVLYSSGGNWAAHAAGFLNELKEPHPIYLLVLTRPERVQTLIDDYGGGPEFAELRITLQPAGGEPPPFDPEVIYQRCAQHDQAQALTTWGLAWFHDVSVNATAELLEHMLARAHADDFRRAALLDDWRKRWAATLADIGGIPMVDPLIGPRVTISGDCIEALQTYFGGPQLARHREALTLLRESGALAHAADDVLRAFADLMAHIALTDPAVGRFVLVTVLNEWLPVVDERRRYVVVSAILLTLARSRKPELSSGSLLALCHAGQSDIAGEILKRQPERYMREDWYLDLCRRVFPALRGRHQQELWTRLFKSRSSDLTALTEAVFAVECSWPPQAAAEFAGRLIEEALLGVSRERRSSLIVFLSEGGHRDESAGHAIVARLSDPAFLTFARHRSLEWSISGRTCLLFEAWLARSLSAAAPQIPPRVLIAELRRVGRPVWLPRGFSALPRAPSAAIVALLLVEARSTFGVRSPAEYAAFLSALVPDLPAAKAVSAVLRVFSARLLQARRIVMTLGRQIPRSAVRAAVELLTVRSVIVGELRRSIDRVYLEGVKEWRPNMSPNSR